MKKFFTEFKEFALRGNVMNLAVAVIIGAAFQAIVTSLTTNILSPIIGLFVGKNFDALKVTVRGADLLYGAFITSVISFIILAFVVFLMVKLVNRIMSVDKKPETPQTPATRECPYCMTQISVKATRCPACTSLLENKRS
ncbi:MAG: large conductance mechanosensitive channel protein MscL [Firmicutes bacterium]|nr:large conductance mechanosensitive channel protein MscL [Bacillota bacterium]